MTEAQKNHQSGTGGKTDDGAKTIPFIRDIEPYLYGKPITYVDVGAFKGSVFRELLRSKLSIREAHLIEPNPKSFARLKERADRVSAVKYVHCHNVAISSASRRLSLRDEGGMTKVVPLTAEVDSSRVDAPILEIDAMSLDELAGKCGIERISLLKIDVEGHEIEVINGAGGLLSSGAVDIVYIEAGLDPDSSQQTYYRRIEDALIKHGYRMFRIYEQTNEWSKDSVFLRRINIAFMSESFAAQNPYRVSNELFEARAGLEHAEEEKSRIESGISEQQEAISALQAQGDMVLSELSVLRQKHRKGLASVSGQVQELSEWLRDEQAEHARTRDSLGLEVRSIFAGMQEFLEKLVEERVVQEARHASLIEDVRSAVEGMKGAAIQLKRAKERVWKERAVLDHLSALESYTNELERNYKELLGSTSWRMTAPLRALVASIKGVPSGNRPGVDWVQKRPNPQSISWKEPVSNKELAKAKARAIRKATEHQVRAMRRRMLDLGFVEAGYARLQEWANDSSKPMRRRLAARELVLFHLNEADHAGVAQALELLPRLSDGENGKEGRRKAGIMEAEALSRSGDMDAARAAADAALGHGKHPDVFLARANLETDTEQKLHWINAALRHLNLEELRLIEGPGSVYDRLDAVAAPLHGAAELPLVTVIVPAYNSEATISTALRSLLAQTYTNLEVIVVDDCSTDDTTTVVERFCRRDARIKLLNAERNGGPYVARNLALRVASGEFITCHDADDWSHPRKIELQAMYLIADPAVMADQATQARASDDLLFNRRGNYGAYCFGNLSSLMFRRVPVLDALGCWDSVRFMADGEFLRRLEFAFGGDAIRTLEGALTSFQRKSDGSLTENGQFGYHGFLMGARKEYFDASFQHHASGASLKYEFPQVVRPFVVPEPMLPDRPMRGDEEQCRHYDVIIVSDFRLAGGSTLSSIEEIKAQAAAGLKTGIVQMSRFDMDPTQRRTSKKVRELINSGLTEFVVYGESASCDLLIVRYPPVLDYFQRYVPEISAKNVRVIVNQPPMSDYGPSAVPRYRIPECERNLRRIFGSSGPWYPIGPAVREALHEHHSEDLHAIELAVENWENIVDIEQYRRKTRRPLTAGARPRIGRHARDHDVKWPGDKETLLSVYPDSDKYEVYVMGGGAVPERILGRLPQNWRVIEFDGLSVREYLDGLDVFIYYTHRDWVEAFGRVVIEAMAAGVPVILPPSYQTLFEDAALYAEPADVLSIVDRLVADPVFYQSRVDLAHEFVDRRFGYAMHIDRISGLISREIAGGGAIGHG